LIINLRKAGDVKEKGKSGKGESIMKNKIYFTLGFTFCAFGFSMILLGVLHNWSI
jgi:hypothetical protein